MQTSPQQTKDEKTSKSESHELKIKLEAKPQVLGGRAGSRRFHYACFRRPPEDVSLRGELAAATRKNAHEVIRWWTEGCDQVALVLQVGGALAAYQAGV
jgi:hypothetical protein